MTGQRVDANVAGRWRVHPPALDEVKERLRARAAEAGAWGVEVRELSDRERALLGEMDDVVVDATRVRVARDVDGDPFSHHSFLGLLNAAPFRPPSPEDGNVSKHELDELVRRGLVVKSEGLYFSRDALTRAAEVVAHLLEEHPQGVSASQVREALGTTRRFALPILGFLDANAVTRRRGDLRTAGPRLPRLEV